MPAKEMPNGSVFGRLTVVGPAIAPGKKNGRHYACICECGNSTVAYGGHLRSGTRVSCGCSMPDSKRQHGMAKRREYSTWANMKDRCFNPNSAQYEDYGGRGITVCDRWASSFEAFFEDMGRKPHGMSIDRIDNNRGYEPGNCRWAAPVEQANNKRTTWMATIGGRTMPVSEWARQAGVSYSLLADRLRKGVPEKDLFIKPHVGISHRPRKKRSPRLTLRETVHA